MSIVFIIIAIIMLNLSNNALKTLHENSGMAVVYITLFIISMVFAWASVASPIMPKTPQTIPAQQKETSKKSGFAIASLILGALSFIPVLGILLGILGITFSFIFFKQFKEKKIGGMGMATAGIILGFLGTALSLTFLFAGIMNR